MDRVFVVAVNSGRLWREGLGKLLEGSEFTLHPEPETIASNLEAVEGMSRPPIFLYRDRGFSDSGAEWLRQVRKRAPSAKLVVVTGQFRLGAFREAVAAGADGYLTDDICGRIFIRMLDLIVEGEKVIPSSIAALLTQHLAPAKSGQGGADIVTLSEAEDEILRRVMRGESNKQIANALGLSESTVKGRVKLLLRKINATNRTQAAIWGVTQRPGYADPALDGRAASARLTA